MEEMDTVRLKWYFGMKIGSKVIQTIGTPIITTIHSLTTDIHTLIEVTTTLSLTLSLCSPTNQVLL